MKRIGEGGGRGGGVGDLEGPEGKDMFFLRFPVIPFPHRPGQETETPATKNRCKQTACACPLKSTLSSEVADKSYFIHFVKQRGGSRT